MSVSGGKYLALDGGKEIGCEAIQIFIRNVRSWSSGELKKDEITSFHKKKEELKNEIWPIISHNSYLINLASRDKELLKKSYDAMLDELKKADQLGIEFENMHPGTIPTADKDNITKEEALIQIANQINNLIGATKDSKVKILLETTAGQGEGIGNEFQHFKTIIDKIKTKDRIGICFDTAHSFAAGYDFTTKKKYDDMWDEFDNIIGLKYLFAFHLNDTDKELGSRVDRHAHIGEGKIGKEPFSFFIKDERFKNMPGILETPEGEKKFAANLKILKLLRNP